jgi:hypothetical protein
MNIYRIHQKKYKFFKICLTNVSRISVLVLFLLIIPSKIWAQYSYNIYSYASLAEKVYLQLDGKVYTAGNIIWFKCIVVYANNHVPSPISKVLYVELINPDETINQKKLIKLENGIGEGFFNLDNDLHQGHYLIRAYTQWNKNFSTDFIFKEYIQVFSTNVKEKMPITNITLIKNHPNDNYLEASFNPLEIDSLHKANLDIFITLKNKIDTLNIKKGKDKKYSISYPVSTNDQFVTLQIQTENKQRYSKTIVLNDEFVDLQFFPESGELVHGLQSRIGFKAIDANGQGKIIQGDIVDEQDSIIIQFKSNVLGMGSFILEKVDSTKNYFARIISKSANNLLILFPLPKVVIAGNKLAVERQGNNIIVKARSNYLENDSISVQFSFRGMSFYEKKVCLVDGAIDFTLSGDQLPEGIISFSMLDNKSQIVAERLYFNERLENRINIKLSSDKNYYSKRELTNLSIKTTDSKGTPIKTNLSLLVINKQQLGKIQDIRKNILSWFLLESELKGEIENPGFYFNNDSNRCEDLDALMLTQGWRKYNYSKPFNELRFKPESSLTVSGQVNGILSSKKGKKAELVMLTFGKSKNAYSLVTDSLGNFTFILDDEFGQKMNALIQTSKKSGKKMNYSVSLDKKESPPIVFNHIKSIAKLDSTVMVLNEKNAERKKIDEAFPLDSGNILIKEVEVKAYNLTPNRKLVMKEFGEPDVIIDGKSILEKEQKWSYGLYSVLMFNFPNQVRIFDAGGGFLYANVVGSQASLVIIDGIPAKLWEYQNIPFIPPGEVSSFEIIKCAINFNSLYYEVTGHNPDPPFICGSIIAIYTYSGKGIYGAYAPTGLIKTTVPVFSEPREFYSPKYVNSQYDNWNKPDLRALIDWKPVILTDDMGNAQASFYNADNTGKMTVIVEAISENGNIGYQELDYEIEGKEKEFIIIK